MPEASTPSGVSEAAYKPDADAIIPRVSMQEQGFVGLRVLNRHVLEETQLAFRYPAFIRTVNEMRNNPTVGAALNVYRFFMTRVRWHVEPHPESSPIDKERAKIVETMMHDMDTSWDDFISTVIPYLEYGFAINEKVFRRRLKRNGSKYNDGLVGLKRLATRSQDTIWGWIFNKDHSEIVACQQTLKNMEYGYLYADRLNDQGFITIDRDKFLLFTTNSTKNNPEGNSILKNIYLAYKQLSILQEQQLIGIAKDVQGILKIEAPVEYFDPNGSANAQATLKAFQNIIDNYNAGQQRGLLVPNMIDEATKQPKFSYSLMEAKGNSKYDTAEIIKAYQQDILTALNVDILRLGADGGGSFSLAEAKTSVLALAIDSKLKEIQSTLNQDLMRDLYKFNGWDMTNMAKFVYSDIQALDLNDYSAAIQRIFAVGAIEVDREVLNSVRKSLGVAELPEDEPVDKDKLSTNMSNVESKSGSGMAVGNAGNSGTAKIGGSGKSTDKSIANKENAP
jgi:hypothetical protein